MADPYQQVVAHKLALLRRADGEPADQTGPTGIAPADHAIEVVRRHPVILTAALAAGGVAMLTSRTLRMGLMRVASSSLKGLAIGAALRRIRG